MRQWIAAGSLFSLLALAGCQTSMEGTNGSHVHLHRNPSDDGPGRSAAAGNSRHGRPEDTPRTGRPTARGGAELRGPGTPAPDPVHRLAARRRAASAGRGAAVPAAPSAEEIAQALKENEDALATLRTAERALEASHRKLEELLRRQAPPSATTLPPAQPVSPLFAPGYPVPR